MSKWGAVARLLPDSEEEPSAWTWRRRQPGISSVEAFSVGCQAASGEEAVLMLAWSSHLFTAYPRVKRCYDWLYYGTLYHIRAVYPIRYLAHLILLNNWKCCSNFDPLLLFRNCPHTVRTTVQSALSLGHMIWCAAILRIVWIAGMELSPLLIRKDVCTKLYIQCPGVSSVIFH